MICYQDTNVPVKCPFCNSSDQCEHLLAIYDVTFDSIEGGVLIENDTIEDLLSKFFIDIIKTKGFSFNINVLKNELISDIWEELVISKEYYLIDGKFDETEFYLPSHFKYLFDKLDEIIYPEYGEYEGGPGQSSFYKIYYTDNAVDIIGQLNQLIENEIDVFNLNAVAKNRNN
jgi:hypothetical protein